MYEPQVDDYVRWTTALGMVHEGWVYFKCDPTPKKRGFPQTEHYITIELGVKDMPVNILYQLTNIYPEHLNSLRTIILQKIYKYVDIEIM